MYKFRDINDASVTRVLPSEALQINGEYIEDLIPGYRTLYVNDTNTRVFFMSRVNRHAPNSIIYYLDELIKVK